MSTEIQNNEFLKYTGVYYAIPAIGGFNIQQHFGGPIPIITDIPVKELDLTLALQMKVDVHKFNEKLNIFVDGSNNLISSPLDTSGGSFPNFITFQFQDIIQDLAPETIVSMGSFSGIYLDFRRSIVNYYKLSSGVSIFDTSGETQYNEGNFTKNDFINLFAITPLTSETNSDISGNMSIYYIPQLMQNLYENDPFLNRSNKTINEGFAVGDVILLESGITIRLDLYNKAVTPITGTDISNNINYKEMILLSKSYNAPLVLHLEDL
jgi:hypothetical protein